MDRGRAPAARRSRIPMRLRAQSRAVIRPQQSLRRVVGRRRRPSRGSHHAILCYHAILSSLHRKVSVKNPVLTVSAAARASSEGSQRSVSAWMSFFRKAARVHSLNIVTLHASSSSNGTSSHRIGCNTLGSQCGSKSIGSTRSVALRLGQWNECSTRNWTTTVTGPTCFVAETLWAYLP